MALTDTRFGKGIIAVLILFVVAILILAAGWQPVNPGNEKVLMDKNDPKKSLGSGWHVINPVTQSTNSYSVRPQIYVMSGTEGEGEEAQRNDAIESKTEDGNIVFVDVAFRYKITDSVRYHILWGTTSGYDGKFGKFENEKLRSPSRDLVRDIVGTINSERVHRGATQQSIEDRLADEMESELQNSGVTLIGVDIRNIRFTDSYQAQLEEKAKAKQQFEIQDERARADANAEIVRAQADKNASIIRAEGEAEANRKVSDSLSDEVLEYRQIEAYDDANTIYVPVGNDGLPMYVEASNSTSSNSSGN